MIVVNSATSLIYLVASEGIRKNTPNMQAWAFPVLIVGGIFNLFCAISLFRWKRWGFWGCACSAAVIFVVNLLNGINPVAALGGLLGVAVLFGVLHIGRERLDATGMNSMSSFCYNDSAGHASVTIWNHRRRIAGRFRSPEKDNSTCLPAPHP